MNLPDSAESILAVPAAPPRSKRQLKANAIATERAAQARWKHMLNDARTAFSKVPPEELTKVNGNLNVLAGLVQLRYQTTRLDADQQVQRFFAEHAAIV